MKNIETRSTGEVNKVQNDSRNVIGYGIVFNSMSRDLGGFKEIIEPSAIEGILEKSDVLALLNHDVNRGVLARSKFMDGSLKLEVDEKGLRYEFDAPNTALGNELLEGIKRGDITTSSFAFVVAEDGDKIERMEDGTYLRTIVKFDEIRDVSPVYQEAYEDTSVVTRSINNLEERELEELILKEENDKKEELNKYFQTLEDKLK